MGFWFENHGLINLASMVPQSKSKLVIMNNEAECKQWRTTWTETCMSNVLEIRLIMKIFKWSFKTVFIIVQISWFPQRQRAFSVFFCSDLLGRNLCNIFDVFYTSIPREIRELIKHQTLERPLKILYMMQLPCLNQQKCEQKTFHLLLRPFSF